MTDMFDSPSAGGGGIKWDDLNGSLLLFKPHSVEEGIPTAFGEKSAVRADVHALDGAAKGQDFMDTLVFPGKLQGQIKHNAGTGRYCLGRLGTGAAKPGQRPPWQLADPTDSDKDTARAWINANSGPGF